MHARGVNECNGDVAAVIIGNRLWRVSTMEAMPPDSSIFCGNIAGIRMSVCPLLDPCNRAFEWRH